MIGSLSAASPDAIFNIGEAIFWMVIAVVVAWQARTAAPAVRLIGYVLAVAFVAFAGTDIVESRTGAWYRPWWLLVYNAACLAVIAGCFLRYRAVKAAQKVASDDAPA